VAEENEPLEIFGSFVIPNGTLLHETASFIKRCRAALLGGGAIARTEHNKREN
jgi:hypothetical protein